MISLSNFLENKKESAILTCLGAKIKSISKIYLLFNLIITFSSLLFGFGISIIAESSLNSIIYKKFGLKHLIDVPYTSFFRIPFGFVIGILLLAVLSAFLFTIVPILAYKNFSITDELRDE